MDSSLQSCSFKISLMLNGNLRQVHINAIRLQFQNNEAHFSKAQYFYKMEEECEVAATRPRGIPLPTWENLEGNKAVSDYFGYTSIRHPRPSKQIKPTKRESLSRKMMLLEKYTYQMAKWTMSYDGSWGQILPKSLGPLIFLVL